jgi:predicted nuclease of predicted toxin-antitoxin system
VLRFHLDESVSRAVAEGLRRRGIDVTVPADVGLLGAADIEHLHFANATDRVLVSHDRHFPGLASRGANHAGIAYGHQAARTVGEIVRHLALMADCLEPDEIAGRIEYL